MKNRSRFYITRLKRASLSEFLYRGRQELRQLYSTRLVRQGRLPCSIPHLSPMAVNNLLMPALHGSVDHCLVERILDGLCYSLNTGKDVITAVEYQWRTVCSCAIDHAHSPVDIRAIWEPVRLQHVTLLLAWLRQHPDDPLGQRIKEFARDEILGWLAKNPFLYGPHYLSVMECGLRLPVFFYALKTLNNLNSSDAETILKGVFLHAWWIEKNLSLHSSLGNHTVCEAMGLVFAGSMFRETEEGRLWLKSGINLLAQELAHQVLEDGGPAEQAFGYHRFVIDVYCIVTDFLERNNLHDCSDFKQRLLLGEEFLKAFQDCHGNVPAIGDSDDGFAVAPGVFPQRGVPVYEEARYRFFRESGYSVIKSSDDICLIFDHGPLGMAPLFNHGHADALSITLSFKGEPLLVDPGTYRYNGVPEWRKYFKGTRAHNTVTIDGLDQAVQETGFIWSKPFVSELVRKEETEQGLLLEAVNDGYIRLRQPVKHSRTILFAGSSYILVKDTFSGKDFHDYELNFHLHPDAATENRDGWWHVQKGESRICMTLLKSNNLNYVNGQESPILGWYSPAYGIKQKSGVLQTRKRGLPGEVSFVTAICLDGPVPIKELERLAESL